MAKLDLVEVRALVKNEFARFGYSDDQVINESILLQSSNYMGHRFKFRRWNAVWQLNSTTIRFYEEGQEIKKIELGESPTETRSHKRAA